MADPVEDLIRALLADADGTDRAAQEAYRAAAERARTAWANGMAKGLDGLLAERAARPAAPG